MEDARKLAMLRKKAWSLVEARNREEALRTFAEAIDLAPEDPALHIEKGEALARLGEADASLASYERAAAVAPSSAGVRAELGKALARAGRADDALAAFAAAVELDPRHPGALGAYGNALAERRRFAEALALFERLLEARPRDAEALLCRGLLLSALDRRDEGLASLERALAENPKLLEAYIHRVRILRAAGRLAEARKAAGEAISKMPRCVDAYLIAGEVALDAGSAEEAQALADKALALEAHSAPTPGAWRLKAAAHAKLGREAASAVCAGIAARHAGDATGALEAMDRAIALDERFIHAWIHKGAVLESLERPQEALACYERARAIDGRDARVLLALGLLLHDKLGRPGDGMPLISKAIALDSKRWADLPPHLQKRISKPIYW